MIIISNIRPKKTPHIVETISSQLIFLRWLHENYVHVKKVRFPLPQLKCSDLHDEFISWAKQNRVKHPFHSLNDFMELLSQCEVIVKHDQVSQLISKQELLRGYEDSHHMVIGECYEEDF